MEYTLLSQNLKKIIVVFGSKIKENQGFHLSDVEKWRISAGVCLQEQSTQILVHFQPFTSWKRLPKQKKTGFGAVRRHCL